MAPGPGRNALQLPASFLQPTTSIYRTAALRTALSAHPSGLREEAPKTSPRAAPRDADQLPAAAQREKLEGEKKTKALGRDGWEVGVGGVAATATVSPFFPRMSLLQEKLQKKKKRKMQKKMYSPNDATKRCGGAGGGWWGGWMGRGGEGGGAL